MGDNESGKAGMVEGTVKAVTGLVQAVPVYQDGLQPAVKQVGTALETAGGLANLCLRPVRTLSLGLNLLGDRLDGWLREKLAGVPHEKIVEPRPHIAGPALLGLALVEDEPELRDLYVKLLATSMNADTARLAHPGFVEIVKQLTPDEARLVRDLHERFLDPRESLAALEIFVRVNPGVSFGHKTFELRSYGVFTDLHTVTNLEAPEMIDVYIDNLTRLGILVRDEKELADPKRYHAIQNAPAVKALREEHAGSLHMPGESSIDITDFGVNFLRACAGER